MSDTYIPQAQLARLERSVAANRVVVVYGPRRVGKTTLIRHYVQVERLKYNLYTGRLAKSYFWRTYDRQEIDLVEEWGGRIHAAEMKWSAHSKARTPRGWSEAYPDSSFRVVHQDNYLDFITQ